MSTTRTKRTLVVCSLFYLLLPNIFWLFGWVETWIAIILSLVLTCGLVHWLIKEKDSTPPLSVPSACLLLPAGLCACYVFLMGFNGIVPQPGDFIVRNALYNTLINSDWPLYSNRGEYFVYYHAYVLLPAWVASFVTCIPSWLIMAVWVWVGLTLASCCLALRYRSKTLFFLLALMALGTPAAIIINDHHFLANYWPIKDLVHEYRSMLPAPLTYPGMWDQCSATYNQGINVLILLCMIHAKLLRGKGILLASGLIVVCSPIAAPAVFLYSLVKLLKSDKKALITDFLKSPFLYAELVLIILLGIYFSSGAGSQTRAGWDVIPLKVYITSIISIMIPILIFGWRYRSTGTFRLILVISVILPLIWVGVDNNELLFKCSILPYFFMTAFLVGSWRYANLWKKAAYIVLLTLCSYNFIYTVRLAIRDFQITPEHRGSNIHNEWNGSLDHPEHYFYSRFWGKRPPHFFK